MGTHTFFLPTPCFVFVFLSPLTVCVKSYPATSGPDGSWQSGTTNFKARNFGEVETSTHSKA